MVKERRITTLMHAVVVSGRRLGRVKRKVLPALSSLSARMAPPWVCDDVAGDGEAEAGAAGLAGAGLVDAVEALEDAGEVLGGDARAEVAHAELDRRAMGSGTSRAR